VERIVAVKILREQWNESAEVIARTRDEARLLARLRHKNILKVEELAEIEGQPAIIMEFVDGLDLKQLVEALAQKGKRVPVKTTLEVALATASALEAAYMRIPYGLEQPLRVVHRDIKPSNVMVSVEGEVRVLDFGTARSTHAFRSAQTGALRFGSLKYMSPERRDGDRGEHAADIYALGLLLLEVLRGEWLPLLPMDIAEHDQAVSKAIARLDQLGMPNREWDMTLRQVLAQMLAGNPALRPNAEQVVKLMRAFVEQASGAGLEAFAADTVAPLTREVRGGLTGGAMAGTRFMVNMFPAASDPPAEQPKLAAVRDEPRRPGNQTWNPEVPHDDPGPRTPAPESRRETEKERGGGGTAMLLGLGAAGLLAVGAVILVLAAGGFAWWWYARSSEAPAVVVATPPSEPAPKVEPPVTPPPPMPTGAPVKVSVEGTVQWIHLDSAMGQRVAEGTAALDASVAADTYTLSMKLVGKPVLKAQLKVTTKGVDLTCAPDRAGAMKCDGVRPALVLKP
jgi:serine/threonine-protein kinase